MADTAQVETMARSFVDKAAAEGKSFSTNPNAALFATAGNMQLGAAKTDEVRFTEGGETYIAQGFEGGLLYVRDGDWTNIHRLSWSPPVAAPSHATSATEGTPKATEPAPQRPGGILGEIESKIQDAMGGHRESGTGAGKQG